MFMLYRHWEDAYQHMTYQPHAYQWVSLDNMSPYAGLAVIASEDQLFFEHYGFDVNSIKASLNAYNHGGRLRGASTISQQVAKNVFLTPAKNLLRKGLEVWFTGLLELCWGKQRILEVYLNIAEFGDHLFGIEAASQRYFGISAQKLNRSQAALLAATLPNPLLLKANKPSDYVLKRQRWIIQQMSHLDNLRVKISDY